MFLAMKGGKFLWLSLRLLKKGAAADEGSKALPFSIKSSKESKILKGEIL